MYRLAQAVIEARGVLGRGCAEVKYVRQHEALPWGHDAFTNNTHASQSAIANASSDTVTAPEGMTVARSRDGYWRTVCLGQVVM